MDNTLLEEGGKILGLTKLNLDNCLSLEVLDCAENRLEELTLNNHPKLLNASCRTNTLKSLIINNCPQIECLDFSRQNILEWRWNENRLKTITIINNSRKKLLNFLNIEKRLKSLNLGDLDEQKKLLEKKIKLLENIVNSSKTHIFIFLGSIKTKVSIDKSSYSNIEKISFTEGVSYFNPEGILISCEDFPSLKEYGLGTANDPAFEEYLDKKREEERQKMNLMNLMKDINQIVKRFLIVGIKYPKIRTKLLTITLVNESSPAN